MATNVVDAQGQGQGQGQCQGGVKFDIHPLPYERYNVFSKMPAMDRGGAQLEYYQLSSLPPLRRPYTVMECLQRHVPPPIAPLHPEDDDTYVTKVEYFGMNASTAAAAPSDPLPLDDVSAGTRTGAGAGASTKRRMRSAPTGSEPSAFKSRKTPKSLDQKMTPSSSTRKPDGTASQAFWKNYMVKSRDIRFKMDREGLVKICQDFVDNSCAKDRLDPSFTTPWWMHLTTADSQACEPTAAFRQALAEASPSYHVYQDYSDRQEGWFRYHERRGGELPNTSFIKSSLCHLCNMWIGHVGNLKPHVTINGKWDHPDNLDTAIPDLGLWRLAHGGKPGDEWTQSIVENKPYLTEADIVWLMYKLLLSDDGLGITLSMDEEDKAKVHFDFADKELGAHAAIRDILVQVVEQMHKNRARYAIISNYERYILLRLDDYHRFTVYPVIHRDANVPWTDKWRELLRAAKVPVYLLDIILEKLRPVENVNILVLLAALTVRTDPLGDKDVLGRAAWMPGPALSSTTLAEQQSTMGAGARAATGSRNQGSSHAMGNQSQPRGDGHAEGQDGQGGVGDTKHADTVQVQVAAAPANQETNHTSDDDDPLGLFPFSNRYRYHRADPRTKPVDIGLEVMFSSALSPATSTLCDDLHYIDRDMLNKMQWTMDAPPRRRQLGRQAKLSDPPSLISDRSGVTDPIEESLLSGEEDDNDDPVPPDDRLFGGEEDHDNDNRNDMEVEKQHPWQGAMRHPQTQAQAVADTTTTMKPSLTRIDQLASGLTAHQVVASSSTQAPEKGIAMGERAQVAPEENNKTNKKKKKVELISYIGSGRLFSVFRGMLLTDDDTAIPIVAKFTNLYTFLDPSVESAYAGRSDDAHAALENEIGMYHTTNLSALQGQCVPKFHGSWTGIYDIHQGLVKDPDRQVIEVRCVLLEDCGLDWETYVDRRGDGLVVGLKTMAKLHELAWKALDRLHAVGICHHDIRPSNVLVNVDNEGDKMMIHLIDFETATFSTKATDRQSDRLALGRVLAGGGGDW